MANRVIDHVGDRFGKLVVLSRNGQNKWKSARWLCRCDCGNEVTVGGRELRVGDTKSCGCSSVEWSTAHNYRHGKSVHGAPKEVRGMYQSWADMKYRCSNPNAKAWKRYGGRGITVCARWDSFDNFVEDMEDTWEPGLSIDRIDVDGNYTPDNCEWVTRSENSRRAKSND